MVPVTSIEPITLTGKYVVLEPLRVEHHDGLVEAVRDGELWKLLEHEWPMVRNALEFRLGEAALGPATGSGPLRAPRRSPLHSRSPWDGTGRTGSDCN